jgi:ribonuclease P protein subunit RPR2
MSKKNSLKLKKKTQKIIALRRINQLFFLAEKKALCNDFILADRYVDLARRISMRYLVPIPKEFKRSFCKYCYCYLLPDKNCRIRIKKGKIVVFCLNCSKFMRFPLRHSRRVSSARLK